MFKFFDIQIDDVSSYSAVEKILEISSLSNFIRLDCLNSPTTIFKQSHQTVMFKSSDIQIVNVLSDTAVEIHKYQN